MYEEKEGKTTITCDKCNAKETVMAKKAGESFYKNGWAFNLKARKYIHLCYCCARSYKLQKIARNKKPKPLTMLNKLDYRKEVLKSCPNAVRYKNILNNYSAKWQILDNSIANSGKQIGKGYTPSIAWENAFNNLKNI